MQRKNNRRNKRTKRRQNQAIKQPNILDHGLYNSKTIYRPIKQLSVELLIKEQFPISIAAAGTDTNLWIRPNSAANSSTSFNIFSSTQSGTAFTATQYYDLMSFPKLAVWFSPGFHVGSTVNSFTQNEYCTGYVLPLTSSSPLSQYGDCRYANPLQDFKLTVNPMEFARSMGQAFWIPTSSLYAGTIENYSVPLTVLMYFPAPIGTVTTQTDQVGTVMVESVIVCKGRNS